MTRPGLDGVKIIVVEDSFPVADGLKMLVEQHGAVVLGMAGNTKSALQLVADANCDLALLDIQLDAETISPFVATIAA